MTAGYFARDPKILTQAQMVQALKARSRIAATQDPNALRWGDPQKATQRAENGPYEVRGTRIRDGVQAGQIVYWAWVIQPKSKLLGHSPDPELARSHCETHHLNARNA